MHLRERVVGYWCWNLKGWGWKLKKLINMFRWPYLLQFNLWFFNNLNCISQCVFIVPTFLFHLSHNFMNTSSFFYFFILSWILVVSIRAMNKFFLIKYDFIFLCKKWCFLFYFVFNWNLKIIIVINSHSFWLFLCIEY